MSPSTMDSILPAVIFGSTVTGTFLFATAPDIQSAIIGLSIVSLAFLVCYFEFLRTIERSNPNKID